MFPANRTKWASPSLLRGSSTLRSGARSIPMNLLIRKSRQQRLPWFLSFISIAHKVVWQVIFLWKLPEAFSKVTFWRPDPISKQSDRGRFPSLSALIPPSAYSIAIRCPLPYKYLLVQAWQVFALLRFVLHACRRHAAPLVGCMTQKNTRT